MKQLRFHKELYSAEAVSEAVVAYEGYASVTRGEQGDHLLVELSAAEPGGDEEELAGEFANHVLGATVDRGSQGQKR